MSLKAGLPDEATELICGYEIKIYLVAGQAESTAEVLWWDVKSVWRAWDDPSLKDSEGEVTSISGSCPQCGFPMVHLIVCRHSRKLRSCLHFSTRCRASSHVLPGLSRPLTAGRKAPPPYRQEGVHSIHTGHQEAKDLHRSGNRKQNNNMWIWVRTKLNFFFFYISFVWMFKIPVLWQSWRWGL